MKDESQHSRVPGRALRRPSSPTDRLNHSLRSATRAVQHVLVCVILAAGTSVAAEPHVHADHTSSLPIASNAQARYVPDAPLVKGMQQIRQASRKLAQTTADSTQAAKVTEHVDEIRKAIDAIFVECKLAPEPDAALHPVLARLLAAVNALGADPADVQARTAIQAAIGDYEQLFGALQ